MTEMLAQIETPEEIEVKQARRNELAVKIGLPPRGATLTNRYGMQFVVGGHLYVHGLGMVMRQGSEPTDWADPRDLRPVIFLQNLSARMHAFLTETDRCTSKHLTFFDMMPHIRPADLHPEGYAVDYLSVPNLLSLLAPYPADRMAAVPVSNFVNKAGYDAHDCIAPL